VAKAASSDAEIVRLEQKVLDTAKPYEDIIRRLNTIPGVDIIAELGVEMSPFANAGHLASSYADCSGPASGSLWTPSPNRMVEKLNPTASVHSRQAFRTNPANAFSF
jgi:hypothetical protein